MNRRFNRKEMIAVQYKLVYKCRHCRLLFFTEKSATKEQLTEALVAACCLSSFGKSQDEKLVISLTHFHACDDETFGIGDLQRVDRVEP